MKDTRSGHRLRTGLAQCSLEMLSRIAWRICNRSCHRQMLRCGAQGPCACQCYQQRAFSHGGSYLKSNAAWSNLKSILMLSLAGGFIELLPKRAKPALLRGVKPFNGRESVLANASTFRMSTLHSVLKSCGSTSSKVHLVCSVGGYA